MNWRKFFSDFRGNPMGSGDSEEQRYQAFKARFLEEMKKEADRKQQEEQRAHDRAIKDVYGTHGQG